MPRVDDLIEARPKKLPNWTMIATGDFVAPGGWSVRNTLLATEPDRQIVARQSQPQRVRTCIWLVNSAFAKRLIPGTRFAIHVMSDRSSGAVFSMRPAWVTTHRRQRWVQQDQSPGKR